MEHVNRLFPVASSLSLLRCPLHFRPKSDHLDCPAAQTLARSGLLPAQCQGQAQGENGLRALPGASDHGTSQLDANDGKGLETSSKAVENLLESTISRGFWMFFIVFSAAFTWMRSILPDLRRRRCPWPTTVASALVSSSHRGTELKVATSERIKWCQRARRSG